MDFVNYIHVVLILERLKNSGNRIVHVSIAKLYKVIRHTLGKNFQSEHSAIPINKITLWQTDLQIPQKRVLHKLANPRPGTKNLVAHHRCVSNNDGHRR